MNKLNLPFKHLAYSQKSSHAVSTAWEYDLMLNGNQPVKFFSFLIFYKGVENNQTILDDLSEQLKETIKYQHTLLEGNRVSITNEDFFEQCLQRVNSEISLFLRNSPQPLPIHSWAILLGMITPDVNPKRIQFFSSRFGEVTGWLLNNAQLETQKLINIFDTPDELPRTQIPQKFFLNILSSSLPTTDQFFFCSPNLLNYISLSKIKTVISSLSPAVALKHFENQIIFHPNDPIVAALTIKLAPYPILEQQSQNDKQVSADSSMSSLLETQSKTEKLLDPSLGLSFSSILANIKKILKTATSKFSSKESEVIPSSKTLNKTKSVITIVLKSILLFCLGILQILKIRISQLFIRSSKKRSNKGGMELLSKNQTITKVDIWKKQLRNLLSPLRIIFVNNKLSRLFKHPATYVFGIILIASIVAFGYWQNIKKQEQQFIASTREQISKITDNLTQIDSYLIVGRESDAIIILQESLKSFESLPKSDLLQSDFDNLKIEIEKRQRLLRKEIVLTPKNLLENLDSLLESEPKALIKQENSLILAGKSTKKFLSYSEVDTSSEIIEISNDIQEWNSLASLNGTDFLIITNNQTAIFDTKNYDVDIQTINQEGTIKGASFFNSRLYSLNTDKNQILKSNREPGFSILTNWITEENLNISSAVDLAIDGNIFVLLPDNIIKLAKGRLAKPEVIFKSIEPSLTQAKRIWTNSESTRIYVLEPSRILLFQKNGSFIAQLIIEGKNNFQDFYIDEKQNTVYILTTSELFKIKLEL